MNRVKCVDCLHFKTRVLPQKDKKKDEFWVFKRVQKMYKRGTTSFRPEKRIYYCEWDRTPLLESRTILIRLKPECDSVERMD
jgi:hypothetical protein